MYVMELIKKLKLFIEPKIVYAHCDIPCGIYDPHRAIIGALTVLRMIDISDEKKEVYDIARLVTVKEEHAEMVKHEVRIIWGDYLKGEILDKHPEIHELTHSIMLLASGVRQGNDRKTGEELLEKVNQFAEIFWETKGVKTKRVKAPYKPEEEVVQPIL